jgi:hypothetical protein
MEDIKGFLGLPKQEFGIPGYKVAKTSHLLNKGVKISPPRSPALVQKTKPGPDPSKYSPTLEKMRETYWKSSIGKFSTSKKTSYLQDELNRSKSNPGPGSYEKKETFSSKSPFGKFE